MKANKYICVLLVLVVALSFGGCGKSDEAKKADDLIISIGTVTKDSGKQIEDAEFYYSMLSDKQKNQVEHYDYLLQAREEYDRLANFRIVPDVSGKTEEEACRIMDEADIKYSVRHTFKESVEKGKVISTIPGKDKEMLKDTVVEINVSDGPTRVYCENAIMSWYSVGSKKDEWIFEAPYYEQRDELLIIDCKPTFKTAFEWKNTGIGEASLTESFDKSVPLRLDIPMNIVQANEEQDITIAVPVKNLGDERPTNLYCKLRIIVGGREQDLRVSFTMTW